MITIKRKTPIVSLLLALILAACADQQEQSGNPAGEDTTNSNTDADADADNDTDAYTDADSDTDSDADISYYDTDAGESSWDTESIPEEPEEGLITNPFVMVGHDPFSTFAADVDTASYDIFRQYVNQGILPDSKKVRIEEFVNYFAYNYPAPDISDEHPFALSIKAGPGILSDSTSLLRVGIQGAIPPEEERPAANLVFLIDVSGSMGTSDKLGLAQYLARQTLQLLRDGDTVSIVTYSSQTSVRLTPTSATNKTQIINVIDSLTAGGSTNGSDGLHLAYAQAESAFIEDGINHVVLCTDGDFNFNVTSTEGLVDLITQKRESGVTLAVLGFGIGSNDAMMEELSNAGNGVYGVISSQAQADDYVEKRMLGSIVFIAKDMKIQVEFNPEHVLAYRLLGYENRSIADEDFVDDTVDAGEIGSGHRVTALYEIVPAEGTVPSFDGAPEPVSGEPVEGDREVDPADMVLVKIRYKQPDAGTDDPALEVRGGLPALEMKTELDQMDDDFQWAVAVAAFAEVLRTSPYANRDILPRVKSIIGETDWLDPDRNEFVDLFDRALVLLP